MRKAKAFSMSSGVSTDRFLLCDADIDFYIRFPTSVIMGSASSIKRIGGQVISFSTCAR